MSSILSILSISSMSSRRYALAAGLAGLATVATSVFALAGDTRQSAEPLVLTGKRTVLTLPEVPAVGLGFIGGGDLFDASGSRAGEGYSHCSIVTLSVDVPPVVTAHCTTTFDLADGMLHMASLRTYLPTGTGFEDTRWAITGGTDSYATASGDATVTRESQPEVSYKFTINLVTDDTDD